MINTIRKYVVNDLKVAGYTKAMTEAGLEPLVKNVPGRTDLNEPIYKELLESDKPEVAIVVRDSMAVSFINVARLLHIHIPDEIEVIGFQNTKYAELSRPKLSCIETPIYDLGEEAMDLLTKLMDIYDSDDDPGSSMMIALNEVERFKREMINKYLEFMNKEQLKDLDKKIKFLEQEVTIRAYYLNERINYEVKKSR